MQSDDDKTHTHVSLTTGTMASHYRIIEKIGAGGMGEVYLAEDTELNRKVALKFLPLHLCQDADCRARFKREAQAAAKLSHPNIVTIYEVSEFNGRPFFAMEHLEGQSLRDLIAQKDFSLSRAIDIATQLCEGLQEAHAKGIIHRDIKPSNITCDGKGHCKILDFGLASVKGAEKLTRSGSTMGTLHYMSPEQTRGEAVDERSDIFSLGVVLYEMITGQLPFKGDHDPAIIYSIGYEEPEPLARYKSGVSDELQRIVDKTLVKDKNLRCQHADELAADLRRIREAASQPHLSTTANRRIVAVRRRALRIISTSVTILAIVAVLYFGIFRQQQVSVIASQRQVTFFGDVGACDLSPDGSYMAFVRGGSDGDRVLAQNLDGGEPLELGRFTSVNFLHWSPNGTELLVGAWTSPAKFDLVVIPRFGGPQQSRVPHAFRCSEFASADWSPDGSRFIYHSGLSGLPFLVIDRQSGDSSALRMIPDSGWVKDLIWSPRGDRLLYRVKTPTGDRFRTARADGSDPADLTCATGFAPHWAPTGDAIYFLQGQQGSMSLMKLKIDPATGECQDAPKELVSGLQTSGPISISQRGRRLLCRRDESYANLWLTDCGGGSDNPDVTASQLTQGTASLSGPSISPDGQQVAFTIAARGEQHVYTMPLAGGEQKRLTSTTKWNYSPVWSPDGSRVAFVCWHRGGYRVAVADNDGNRIHYFENSLVSELTRTCVWSPGEKILYQQSGNRNFRLLDPESESERPLVTNDSVGWMFRPRFAPTGDKVVLDWNRFLNTLGDRAGTGLWVISLTEPSQTLVYRYSQFDDVSCLGWCPDGRWVYFTNVDSTGRKQVCCISEKGGAVDTVCVLPPRNATEVAMAPDCRRFVSASQERTSDLWLLEDFDSEID